MSNQTEIHLRCGYSIRITALDQWETYGGLIEGVSTMEMNARIVERTVNDAKKRLHSDVHLLKPVETLIESVKDYPFGTPAAIPGVTCVAVLDCYETTNDRSKDASVLPVVWFQPEFAFPIADEIVKSILDIDWQTLARDYYY